jgi:poly(3-hydroxybutyrate) depolymerase
VSTQLPRFLSAALAALLAACGAPTAQQAQEPARTPVACEQLASKFIAAQTRLTSAERVDAGQTFSGMAQPYPIPPHCKVTGLMKERRGADGKPYAIGFEMRLPVSWNGRFLFQANGGNDGVVQPAFGNVVSGGPTSNALMQGFAVLSSDSGHAMLAPQAPGADGAPVGLVGGNLFGLDPQARLDYGYAANGALAPMARQLIRTHYGQAPKRSYMMGCSNGGRHGMVAASRYPEQFDGIVAGNPGFNLPKAAVQHAWDIQAFSSVNGDIKQAFTPADMKLVADKVLEKCDALDGLQDGMVHNLPACQQAFDVQALQCTGAKGNACLSAAQTGALRKVFSGPVNSKGEQLYSDWPWDAGVGASQSGFGSWRSWKLQGPIAGLPIIGALGAGSVAYIFSTPPKPVAGNPPALIKSMLDYSFDIDAPKIFATDAAFTESSMAFMTPPRASELHAFKARGAKLIVYHGNSDPVFSVNDTIDWYRTLDRNHGGRADAFARLFTVPGMNHCQGGPATEQFDMLSAIVEWVEQGKAPQAVLASARPGVNPDVPVSWQSAGKPRTRPLCAYPRQARYQGGDVNDAASFSCQ